MNKWLDTTVGAYRRYFGETGHPIVYEVGSRDGNDGYELAERIYDGPVDMLEDHADLVLFEPNPPQAEKIRQQYPSAFVFELAVSDKNGTAEFLAIDGGEDIAATGSSSLDLSRKDHKPENKKVIQVETRRLDEIIAELRHTQIDIMKVDAEGFTYEVLQSMAHRLSDVKVLHLETEMPGDATLRHSSVEIFDFMRDAGFLCFAREYEWGGLEDQVWVNVEMLRHAR